MYTYGTTDKDMSAWWSTENHYDQPENKVVYDLFLNESQLILNLRLELLLLWPTPIIVYKTKLFIWENNAELQNAA